MSQIKFLPWYVYLAMAGVATVGSRFMDGAVGTIGVLAFGMWWAFNAGLELRRKDCTTGRLCDPHRRLVVACECQDDGKIQVRLDCGHTFTCRAFNSFNGVLGCFDCENPEFARPDPGAGKTAS